MQEPQEGNGWCYEPIERFNRLLLVIYKDDIVKGSLALDTQEEKEEWLAHFKTLKLPMKTE